MEFRNRMSGFHKTWQLSTETNWFLTSTTPGVNCKDHFRKQWWRSDVTKNDECDRATWWELTAAAGNYRLATYGTDDIIDWGNWRLGVVQAGRGCIRSTVNVKVWNKDVTMRNSIRKEVHRVVIRWRPEWIGVQQHACLLEKTPTHAAHMTDTE